VQATTLWFDWRVITLTFEWVQTKPVQLPAGDFLLRIVMDKADETGLVGNFDRFRIEPFHE
jgi:hypothetical protein